MCPPAPLPALVLLASLASFSCSSGPPGRSPPLLLEGAKHPGAANAGGASGATNDPNAGPDADAGPPSSPALPCTELALCCGSFASEDPSQSWCEQTLTDAANPDACARLLTYWGC